MLALTSTLVMGQQNRYIFKLGVGAGNAYADGGLLGQNGVLSDKSLSASSDFLVYQAFAEAFLSDSWGLGAKIHSMPGTTDLQDVQAYAAYYLDNGYLLSERSFLSLFLLAGGAYDLQDDNYFLPLGGGLKFRFGSRVNLNLHMQYRYFPDQWLGEGTMTSLAKYYSGISLSYSFGDKRDAFRAPALYTSLSENLPPVADQNKLNSKPTEQVPRLNREEEEVKEAFAKDSLSRLLTMPDTTKLRPDTSGFMGEKLRSPSLLKADSLLSRLKPLSFLADTAAPKPESPDGEAPGVRDTIQMYRDSLLRFLRFEAERLELENRIKRSRITDSIMSRGNVQQSAGEPAMAAGQPMAGDNRMQMLEQRIDYLEEMNRDLQNSMINRDQQPATEVTSSESAPPTEVRVITESGKEGFIKLDPAQAALLAQQGSRLKRVENQLDELLQRLGEGQASARDTSYVFSSSRDTVVATGDSSVLQATRGLNEKMLAMQREMNRLRSQLDSAEKARLAELNKKPEPGSAPLTTQMVFFATNSTSLSASARQDLQEVIGHAERNPQAKYSITGFTDKSGSAEYNRMLSGKRARAVQEFLKSNGIAEDRLEVESRGMDESLEEKRAQYGRRVEVRLIK